MQQNLQQMGEAQSAVGVHPNRKACRSGSTKVKVPAPQPDLLCERPVTNLPRGHFKLFRKPSKIRNGHSQLQFFFYNKSY
jgi:hypothetical protein